MHSYTHSISTYVLCSSRNGESRLLSDPHYFMTRSIRNASTVYVAINDLPYFVNQAFLWLPSSYRINLVTGLDDFSAPVEVMSSNGGRLGAHASVGMGDFLEDPRLHRWFVQNYDLEGCNPVLKICSDLTSLDNSLSDMYKAKVWPLPIGGEIVY